jgi:hypothetical protein
MSDAAAFLPQRLSPAVTRQEYLSARGTSRQGRRLPASRTPVGILDMPASWIVVRSADQVIVGHYRSRREAAERAFQFSRLEPHVAIRQLGANWPGDPFALDPAIASSKPPARHNVGVSFKEQPNAR